MHHHGTDGSCHPGPGGLFGCRRCDPDGEEVLTIVRAPGHPDITPPTPIRVPGDEDESED